MGKRIISLLLALVMTVSLIPGAVISAFATETIPANVIHAASGTVTMDGELSETVWSPVGELTDGVTFGAVYDTTHLYLGITGQVSDLKVRLNGADAALTQVDGSAHELQISLEQVGLDLYKYDQTAALEITAAEGAWTGSVRFDSSTMGERIENFNNNNRTLKGTTSATYEDGAFMVSLDSTTDASIGNGMSHILSASQSALNITSGVSVVEFDLKFDEIPAYPADSIVYNSYLLVPGFNMSVICNGNKDLGYIFGITNLEEQGLTMVIQHWNGSAYQDYTTVPLNKALNETFRIRMEYEVSTKSLSAYCDDALLCTVTDTGKVSAITSKTGLVNIYTTVNNKAYVSKGNIQLTLSELKTGSLKIGRAHV